MGLLDTGQVVTLFPDIDATDGDGNQIREPGPTSVAVIGRWQYAVPQEDASDGQQVTTGAIFLARYFPAGFAGKATYDGRDWDVIGEPAKVVGASPATSHTRVQFRARSPRAV